MPRTLTAAAVAVIAAAIAYGVVLGIVMRPLSGNVVPWAMLFLPGLLCGVLFVAVVLIPLSYAIRRFGASNRALFVGTPSQFGAASRVHCLPRVAYLCLR